MATYTNQSKNTTSFSNQSKNTATWTEQKKAQQAAKFGIARFGSSRFSELKTTWVNQTKH